MIEQTEIKKAIHGFSGSCAPGFTEYQYDRFSYGIFELIPKKDGSGFKNGKVKVRVYGNRNHVAETRQKVVEIMGQLDAGTYQGPKNVKVK